jgi:hypothetical protein
LQSSDKYVKLPLDGSVVGLYRHGEEGTVLDRGAGRSLAGGWYQRGIVGSFETRHGQRENCCRPS